MKRAAVVGEMRQQCALVPADEIIIIQMIDEEGTAHYYQASGCWPDTSQAPGGLGFYIRYDVRDKIK